MDLPRTKLPMVKNVRLGNYVITGEVDFSRSQDPFEMYEKRWLDSPHLEFADLQDDPNQMKNFIQKWGLFQKSSVSAPQGDIERLWPTIVLLSHELHRDIEPLDSAIFSIKLPWLNSQRIRLKSVLDLGKACRIGEPEYLKVALSQWMEVNNMTVKDFISKPIPLPLPASLIDKKLDRFAPQYLHILGQAAMARSFGQRLISPLGIHAPFLCLGAVYEAVGGSKRERLVTGSEIHYHIFDLLSAMWVMTYADTSRGISRLDCPRCHKTFRPRKRNQKFCSPECREAFRQARFQQNKRSRKSWE
jgi:hypothetical protein